MKLYERARPWTLGEIVAQPEAVAVARQLLCGLGTPKDELSGNSVLIRGRSGWGKTTMALALGHELCGEQRDKPGGTNVHEWDARDLTMDWLRDFESSMRIYGMYGNGRRVTIVNEADNLKSLPDSVARLKTTLEALPKIHTWIFTSATLPTESLFGGSSEAHEDQILSRCHCITLAPPMRRSLECAIYLRTVARAEGLDGASLEDYTALVSACKGNLRSCMQAIGEGKLKKEVAA